jgi:hypothetical protein
VAVGSVQRALELHRIAERARTCAPTGSNPDSSRSHAVFTIKLVRCDAAGAPLRPESSARRLGTERMSMASIAGGPLMATGGLGGGAVNNYTMLSFVDLAGSERQKDTGNSGDRLKESGAINRSLSALHSCLEVMMKKSDLPPTNVPPSTPSATPRATPTKPGGLFMPVRTDKLTQLFSNVFEGALRSPGWARRG